MRVLVVGANGYIGQSLTRLLKEKGCSVPALARSEEIAADLERQGIHPVRGQINNITEACGGMKDHDTCIWLSFIPWEEELATVGPLLSAIEGAGKTFIFTSGTGVLGLPSLTGEWSEESFAEDDPWTPPAHLAQRVQTENFVRGFAQRNVRAMIMRPPLVWGNGGSRQIPYIFKTVEKTGFACYIGRGLNLYTNVHVDDLSDAFWLAASKGVAGALYHTVSGESNFRSIAEAVGEVMKCPTKSISYEEMVDIIGLPRTQAALAVNSRSRSPRARRELGWVPRHLDMIDDIRNGSYRTRYGKTA